MIPISCSFCGHNFMRQKINDEGKLCPACAHRYAEKNLTKGKKMETIDILVKCPKAIHAKIEEKCLADNINFSQYFLGLHEKYFCDSLDEEFTTQENLESFQDNSAKKIGKHKKNSEKT